MSLMENLVLRELFNFVEEKQDLYKEIVEKIIGVIDDYSKKYKLKWGDSFAILGETIFNELRFYYEECLEYHKDKPKGFAKEICSNSMARYVKIIFQFVAILVETYLRSEHELEEKTKD